MDSFNLASWLVLLAYVVNEIKLNMRLNFCKLSVYLKMPVQIKIEHVDPIRSTKYIWLIYYLTQVLGKLFD